MFELYQGDLDLGRVALERLQDESLDALVEDLSYGAVAVAQRLEELAPETLILVGAQRRGREPGAVERRTFASFDADAVQSAVRDAVTGYVGIDLVVAVAQGLGALPARTVAIEVEPAWVGPREELSPTAAAALERALALVRAELA